MAAKTDHQSQVLSKLDAILTKLNVRAEWQLLNEENRRLTKENERLAQERSETENITKRELVRKLHEAQTVLQAIADMRTRLHSRLWPRDWWVGLECIGRAEKYLKLDAPQKKSA